jgi:hypothetical protein
MNLESVTDRIREEFREMPGLRLTPAQAARMWGLEADTCRAVIEVLTSCAFLRWTNGSVVKN